MAKQMRLKKRMTRKMRRGGDSSSSEKVFSILFIILSVYLLCCTKKTNIFYLQIGSGCGMFATSKIGRNFLRLA